MAWEESRIHEHGKPAAVPELFEAICVLELKQETIHAANEYYSCGTTSRSHYANQQLPEHVDEDLSTIRHKRFPSRE